MRAWQVVRPGEPRQALALNEVPAPDPAAGFLRVRVLAGALGLPDVFLCRGSYAIRPELPFTPGKVLRALGDRQRRMDSAAPTERVSVEGRRS